MWEAVVSQPVRSLQGDGKSNPLSGMANDITWGVCQRRIILRMCLRLILRAHSAKRQGSPPKSRYHKIRHARDLLRRIDIETVKVRCPYCRWLFDVLIQTVNAARTV